MMLQWLESVLDAWISRSGLCNPWSQSFRHISYTPRRIGSPQELCLTIQKTDRAFVIEGKKVCYDNTGGRYGVLRAVPDRSKQVVKQSLRDRSIDALILWGLRFYARSGLSHVVLSDVRNLLDQRDQPRDFRSFLGFG